MLVVIRNMTVIILFFVPLLSMAKSNMKNDACKNYTLALKQSTLQAKKLNANSSSDEIGLFFNSVARVKGMTASDNGSTFDMCMRKDASFKKAYLDFESESRLLFKRMDGM